MAAFEVVVAQERIEVALDLAWRDVPGLSSRDTEAFVQQRAVHALDEAVGAGHGDLRRAMFDAFHRQQQFVWMLLGLAAELAAVVGEDGLHRDAECFVEGQHAIVEGVRCGDRHLAGVDLGEGQRAEGIDDDLT